MLLKNSETVHIPPPVETSFAAQEAAIKWLNGDLRVNEAGKRVLVLTYDDSGYLGAIEDTDPDFVVRFCFQDRRLVPAKLDRIEPSDVREGVRAIGQVISALVKNGQVVQVEAPRQYSGAAVLYGLPH
jgi:hypothetical protein